MTNTEWGTEKGGADAAEGAPVIPARDHGPRSPALRCAILGTLQIRQLALHHLGHFSVSFSMLLVVNGQRVILLPKKSGFLDPFPRGGTMASFLCTIE